MSCDPFSFGDHFSTFPAAADNRVASGGRAYGRRNRSFLPIAKLTQDDVLAIRASTDPQAVLALRYGVTRSHISNIVTRRTWAHLPA